MRRQSLPFEIIESGFDWITTTATKPELSKLLLHRALQIQDEELRRGFFIKAWRQSGYSGWACGRVQHGERSDGAIVRLSSSLAHDYWFDLWQITERASRVDWQMTGRTGSHVNKFLQKVHDGFRRHYATNNHRPRLGVISDDRGGFTVSLGSRASDLYFRAYNKGVESGEECYQGCARLELEIKGDAAKNAIAWTLSGGSTSEQIIEGLSAFLADRGVSGFLATKHPRLLCKRLCSATDVVQRCGWLAKSIRPSVRELLRAGYQQEVADALGLIGPLTLKEEN